MWSSALYSLLLCAVKIFYHFCAISFNKHKCATFSNILLQTHSIQGTEIGTKVLSCRERAIYYPPFPLPWCSSLYRAYGPPIGPSVHRPFPILDSDWPFNFLETFLISPFELFLKIRVLWNGTSCRPLYTEYGDTATLETSVIIYQLTRRNMPEFFGCYQHRCENIGCRWYQFCHEDGGSISFRNAGTHL